MFLVREPSEKDAAKFVASQRDLPFTYSEVGATNATPPTSYTVDHNRIQLGSGEQTFRRAVDALKNWRHFDLGWVKRKSRAASHRYLCQIGPDPHSARMHGCGSGPERDGSLKDRLAGRECS